MQFIFIDSKSNSAKLIFTYGFYFKRLDLFHVIDRKRKILNGDIV